MAAYCNGMFNGSLMPGQMCPDGKTIAVAGPAPEEPKDKSNNVTTGVPWNADTSRVLFGREPGRPALGSGAGTVPTSVSVYDITRRDSKGWLTNLKANNPDGYKGVVDLLRAGGFLGAKANAPDSIRRAVDSAAKEAAARYKSGQTEDVDFVDYLYSRVGSGDGSGGKTGRYTGPVESRTVMAESDIKATANALAIELIGRAITDEELKKITRRMRTAEQQQPQVTTGDVASTTTIQGLTSQGREDILREVISENPEFVDYQLDTTVMDLMLEDIDLGKRVARG
jgi:hypothetical protein